MSERKALNKYIPPDYDPSVVKTKNKKKDNRQSVRLALPYSMRCTACGEFIYKGKKFNAKKEFTNDTYLGIKIWRFYIRCTHCSGEITFKTDPKNADYVAENGAVRNFEPWRDPAKETETDEQRLARLEKEEQE
ncbi:hypothetical protein CANCADRAFT_12851, partial [Tortispora caseinolytica NRRL Y-17796]